MEEVGHLEINGKNCPQCDAPPSAQELCDYDEGLRCGKVYCIECGAFVRVYDAG